MVTNVAPYCSIDGHDFSPIVYSDGVEPSGGGIGVEEVTAPSRNYADVRSKGRTAKKYRITARSTDREEIEEFMEIVNNAPEDAVFYPFDAQRFGHIALAHAGLKAAPKSWGAGYNFYEAAAEITCREAWLYGAAQGIVAGAAPNVITYPLANAGHLRAPINYIAFGGKYERLKVARVSVSATGAIWAIDYLNHHVLMRSGSMWYDYGGAWREISSYVTGLCVAVGWDYVPCVVLVNSTPLPMGSTLMKKISIASDGTTWAIDYANGHARRWISGAWLDIAGGNWLEISALNSDTAYAIGVDNYPYITDLYGSYTKIGTVQVSKISVASDGTLYAIALADSVGIRWNGSDWIGLGDVWAGIAALNSTTYYGRGTDNNVYVGVVGSGYTALSAAEYVENLSLRLTLGDDQGALDRKLILCEKLLGEDLFELSWNLGAVHSWEADLTKSWENVSLDVHSKTSGGSIAASILTLDNADYIMIPFYGPLPISGDPGSAYLELQVTALTGDGATCQVALETDLSDMAEVDHDALVVGRNTIYFPDLEGETHVAIGLKAGAAGSISLSGINGTVKRYVAPSKIPWSDPGESFKIRVESTAGDRLRFIQAFHNDRFWY